MRSLNLKEDLQGIRYLFEKVESGERTAEQAYNWFMSAYGGRIIYIPTQETTKKARIIKRLLAGDSDSQVIARFATSRYYVRKIKKEIDEAKARNSF